MRLCSPGLIRPGCVRICNEMRSGVRNIENAQATARVAPLRGPDECVRPYTKDVENA